MDRTRLNLLDEPLIRVRDLGGQPQRLTLPQLLVALGRDAVRDSPALRPHQRHPWHALLVQLAALALHAADEDRPWDEANDWRAALLALIPDLPGTVIFVANEVGLGLVPESALGRLFRDEAGRINQAVAARCGHVSFVAAGLPLQLKG